MADGANVYVRLVAIELLLGHLAPFGFWLVSLSALSGLTANLGNIASKRGFWA
jgi:hypothetical protein